jgi:hypothetical protein
VGERKMRTSLRLFFLTLLMVPVTPALAAEELSVAELLAESPNLSGREVTVEGELVGDYGFRDDGWMWTQLNGDVYVGNPIREGGEAAGSNVGVGVRIPAAIVSGLDHPGGYHHLGPIVKLTGIWKHHDEDRQGESYLDVESLEVIQPGRTLDEGVVWWTIIAGSGLLLASGALWLLRPTPTREK